VLVQPGDDCHAARRDLGQLLDRRFGIEHTTLQGDHVARRGPITIGECNPLQ
jgi:cobalt-zinc-cadmium efflux system protein